MATLIAGVGSQVAVAVSTLVALPFVTRSLTPPEFGVFTTLTGFVVLLSFADFGVGGALATRLAEARGRDDAGASRTAVATAVLASCALGALVAGVLLVSVWVLPWRSLLGAEAVSAADLDAALVAMAFAVGASVPAGIGQRMLYGVHRGGLVNVQLLVGAVATAALLILAAALSWSLPVFVLLALAPQVLVGVSCGVTAVRLAPVLAPRCRHASLTEWKALRASIGWYFAIGVAGATSFQTDALIVSGVLGAATAGVFAVAVRVYGLVTQSLYPAMMQLWPAFGEAYGRGDAGWIRSRLVRITALAGSLSLVAGLLVVGVGRPVIEAWLGSDLVPERGLLVALTCWTAYSLMSAPSFLLLNASGRVHVHALSAIAVAVANLPISLVLTHAVGISGPVWGSLIASAAFSAPVGVVAVRRTLHEVAQRAEA